MRGDMRAIMKSEPAYGAKQVAVPIPKPGPREVLIKVRAAAICGTDVHIYKWDKWAASRIKTPMVFGHEFSGDVVELGDGVTKLQIGQFVSIETHFACGNCFHCLTGLAHICPSMKIVGVDRDGCFAEYVTVPEDNCWKWDIDISPEVAAIQDPFGNAVHTTLAGDTVGKTVAVIGVGPIGLAAIMVARKAGSLEIYATDVSDYRLAMARDFGADLAINVTKEDPVEAVLKATGGMGVDVMLEMSGNHTGIRQGFQMLRKAGFASLLGIPPEPVELDIANAIVFKNATVQGINGRRMWDTWYQARALIKGGLDLNPLITHRFSMNDFDAGMELMMSGECGKVIIYP